MNKISTCTTKNENAGGYTLSSTVTHKVQSLLPYTSYTLTVYAANDKGLGTPSKLENKQTDEAGKLYKLVRDVFCNGVVCLCVCVRHVDAFYVCILCIEGRICN